jgi:FtsZ-interacting cell division protein ZipA
MEEKNRMPSPVPLLITAGLYAGALLVLRFTRDDVIIQQGIHFYRTLNTVILVVGGLATGAILVHFLLNWSKHQKHKQAQDAETARRQVAMEEEALEKERHREILSVSKKMDSQRLRDLLSAREAGAWIRLAQPIARIRMQLDIMDEYQEKLLHLLETNGADSLSNTNEVLDQVEQYLCKNVRKVLNYMDVADEDNERDAEQVSLRLAACHEEGQKQLQQVQEFLFALAEFLNKQGDDDNGMDMLNIYKSTILSSIQDD